MNDILEFLHKVGRLKRLKRTGWVVRGIADAESVADHSFRTAVAALVLSERAGMDKNKCVKMALVHDLAEAIVGDITPFDGISIEEKHEKERKAMQELVKNIDDEKLLQLWSEYEEQKTPEAKFVYELDMIEMLTQALEYEQEHREKRADLDTFWAHTEERLQNRHIKEIYRLLLEKRMSGKS